MSVKISPYFLNGCWTIKSNFQKKKTKERKKEKARLLGAY